ncbi:hypothetical protein FOL46_008266 [Perkinsus olseni]|nr:hypothetical protein FOL46_008266 [Perkinsus olseni]
MVFVEWMGITVIAPLTPWFIEKLSPDMDEGSAASIMVASYAIGNRPALVAYLVDTSYPRDLTFYGVLLSLSVNAGISIGPMIGGALALVTIEAPLYFFGGVCSALFVLLFVILRESRQKLPANATNEDRRPTSSSLYAHQGVHPSKWLIPTTALLAFIGFCAQYLLTGWSTVFGLLGAERYGLNSAQNGLALGLQACVIVVLCILYIPITEHLLSPALTGTVGLAISCLLVIVPFLHNVYWTAVLGTVVGVGSIFERAHIWIIRLKDIPNKDDVFIGNEIPLCSTLGSLFFSGIAYFVNIIQYLLAVEGGICGPIISGILYDEVCADSARDAGLPVLLLSTVALSFLATICCGIVDCGIKYTLRRLST